jgi:hypothetical protein
MAKHREDPQQDYEILSTIQPNDAHFPLAEEARDHLKDTMRANGMGPAEWAIKDCVWFDETARVWHYECCPVLKR